MSMRKPLSSAFIHAESRADRRRAPGEVAGGHGGDEDYVLSQELKAERKTQEVVARLDALKTFLAKGVAGRVERSAAPEPTAEDLPVELRAGPPPDHADFELGRPPLLSAFLPRFGHGEASAHSPSERAFHKALVAWEESKRQEDRALGELRAAAREREAARARSVAALNGADAALLGRVVERALAALPLPFELPAAPSAAVEPASRSLRIELRAPTMSDVMPRVSRYRFAKKRDAIIATPLSDDRRGPLYRRVLAELALLAVDAVFRELPPGSVDQAGLVLYCEAIDPAIGRMARTDLVRLNVERGAFLALDLARVDPIPCLQRLGGGSAFVGKPPP